MVVNQGKEGMQDKGDIVKRNNYAVSEKGHGSPSRDTHKNIFVLQRLKFLSGERS